MLFRSATVPKKNKTGYDHKGPGRTLFMHLTSLLPPIILNAMKFIGVLTVGALVFAGSAAGADKAGRDFVPSKAVVCFVAGIELIDNARNLDDTIKAKKYKQLCSLTGLNAASASKIIEHYKDRPEEWQTVETSVIEMLQSNK